MANLDLTKYGITGATEIIRNPSYEFLYEEEMKKDLEGFDKTPAVPLKTNSSSWTRIPRTPYGGQLPSIPTTTMSHPRIHGKPAKRSL